MYSEWSSVTRPTWSSVTRPTIVVLVGSLRHAALFPRVQRDLALLGNIVLGLDYNENDPQFADVDRFQAADVAQDLWYHKIDLADAVYVINPEGTLGFHSQREVDYAISKGKKIHWMRAPE